MIVPWMRLAADTSLLAMESQAVIWARLTQIAMGRGSPAETMLMVTEKAFAFAEAATTIATGGSAHKVVRGYRRHVKANVRRLRRK